MMKVVYVLLYTVQLLLSRRVTYWPVLTGVSLAVISLFLGGLTIVEQERMMVHLGLGLSHIVVLIFALVTSVQFLHQQIESREIEIILSHPLPRVHYFVGTWFGHFAVILVFQMFIFLIWAWLTQFKFVGPAFFKLFMVSTLEVGFVFSLGFCLACFLRPFLAGFATVTIWLGAYWKEDLQFMAEKTKNPDAIWLGQAMDWIFPPLTQINVRSIYFLTEQVAIPLGLAALTIVLWIAVLISGAMIVFDRRDLG